MPLLTKKRILACKQEATIGTAEVLAAADAAANYYDVEIQADVEFTERMGQGAFGRLIGLVGPIAGTCKFKTQLISAATPALPQWASTLFPACGIVFTSLVAKPVTSPPGSGGVKTVTIGVYEDGLFKRLRGAMGTCVFQFEAGKPCVVEWEFKGVYDAVTDVALIAPNYPQTEIPLKFQNASLDFDSFSGGYGKVSKMSLDVGNTVELRQDVSDASGLIGGIVTDRVPKLTVDPESQLIATNWKPTEYLRTQSATAINWLLGTSGQPGGRVSFAVPWAQLTNVQTADRGGLQIDELEFMLLRNADAGDDEFTITWS